MTGAPSSCESCSGRRHPRLARAADRAVGLAATLPVARVLVDVPLAHLDRPFDYAVPADLEDAARPGRPGQGAVRRAGRRRLRARARRAQRARRPADPAAPRRSRPSPCSRRRWRALCRAVADRYAGTLADVLRLAVPPRHARAEKEPPPTLPPPRADPDRSDHAVRSDRAGAVGLGVLPGRARRSSPGSGRASAAGGLDGAPGAGLGGRASPTRSPPASAAGAARSSSSRTAGTSTSSRPCSPAGSLVPPTRLEADLGPAPRYRAFLAALRGQARVVVGTRAAAFAPVADLGLVVLWDDGDDLHAEPRAPYPHAREVLALRAELEAAAMLLGGWSWTAEGAALVALRVGPGRSSPTGRARRSRGRGSRPPSTATATRSRAAARIPATAWRAAHDALPRAGAGPGAARGVPAGGGLRDVPASGPLPGLLRARCSCRAPPARGRAAPGAAGSGRRGRARTARGGGCVPWPSASTGPPRSSAAPSPAPRSSSLAPTARCLPCPPRTPWCSRPPASSRSPRPVTPAALLLDGDSLLARPDLRAAEEALRRWRSAAALVRPAAEGGVVVVVADPAASAVQALVRGDPAGHAERDLAERPACSCPRRRRSRP